VIQFSHIMWRVSTFLKNRAAPQWCHRWHSYNDKRWVGAMYVLCSGWSIPCRPCVRLSITLVHAAMNYCSKYKALASLDYDTLP
jgi:hypothetical protein